ncbi:V/A-type H+-transporting ATPase subunit I [Parabacteroides sp. PFB2-12]|uniref:V-type ATP synthase subunit I n=1 Tax=unclassified Parabacteroides TaxID=2649774 RepID=UPI0024769729|nr:MULTISPECIES: V-type ATPase 116kDa subunit family protein [unclassified Parabacteroides]MDH6342465.1 V/A-type H+-transporting ATPase subunit I [Parabacteroides sp. PM6-13]MDH6390117.1 V/A-type H+-transporting ATPase subunit I [Parabacteroides sp. PFB2-12]
MIIPMKKYAFMVYHKEYKQFLSTLRDLGVVHIKETKSINDFEDLQQMIAERKRVTTLLKQFKKQHGEQPSLSPARDLNKEEGMALVQTIEELQEERSKLSARKQAVLKDLDYMNIWGDFDMKQIQQLKKEGYELNFFTCPTSKYEPVWGKEYNAFLVNNFQSVTYFVTVTKTGTEIDIDAERPKMPELGLSQLREKVKELNESVRACDERLQTMAVEEYNTLLELDKHLQNEFNLANAVVQTDRQAGDKLMFLEGWVTTDKASDMEEALDKESFFYQELEIQDDDKIPIKLKNNSYAKLFEPITEMYSLPNYKEFDPTPFVAPFFMLFFGLCFGDGGYGLLILLFCTFLKRKASAGVKPYLTLFQWLGAMTVVVGALTGSFFGIALVDIPQFAAVKDYFLSSDNLMTLSIVIGIIHIIYAKAIGAYKTKIQRGLKYSLAPFAWVFVIATLACVFGLPMLDIQLPQPVIYVLYGVAIVCLAVALLYNTPGKNILLNFGSGLWNTYNMVFGLLGDVLSYIRLFAVGLTGSILGGVFNSLAVSMTESLPGVAQFIVMLLILLVGHSLNFGLCMISSLVHPIRLVFVEYYKNSEFEGGGKAYLPFKKA